MRVAKIHAVLLCLLICSSQALGNDARKFKLKASVTVNLTAKILSAEVPQSSGKKALDKSVIDACLKCSQVEPPPQNLEAPVYVQLKFDVMTHGFKSW